MLQLRASELSRVLIDLKLIQSPWAYTLMAIAIVIDIYLLYIFFTTQRPAALETEAPPALSVSSGNRPDRAGPADLLFITWSR